MKYRVKALQDNGKAISSTNDLDGLPMFKGYLLYLRVAHLRTKLGGKLNIATALAFSLYLLTKAAIARKIDFIADLKYGDITDQDPIVLLCLVMNLIALISHMIFRLKAPGYQQQYDISEGEGGLPNRLSKEMKT